MRAARVFVFVALVLTGAAIVSVSARTIASASSYRLAWDQVIGSGDVVAQTRSVGPFHAIASTGSTEVHVRVGAAQSVVVHAQGNIQPLIDTDVDGGTLRVGSHGSYDTDRKTLVEVTVPSLDGVSLSGSGDVTAEGVHAGAMSVVIRGSGQVEMTGSADKLQFTSSGSGEGKFDRLVAYGTPSSACVRSWRRVHAGRGHARRRGVGQRRRPLQRLTPDRAPSDPRLGKHLAKLASADPLRARTPLRARAYFFSSIAAGVGTRTFGSRDAISSTCQASFGRSGSSLATRIAISSSTTPMTGFVTIGLFAIVRLLPLVRRTRRFGAIDPPRVSHRLRYSGPIAATQQIL